MNDKTTTEQKATDSNTKKPGFFQSFFTKLDQTMKEKADAKAPNNCCGGSNSKDGKCC